MNNHKHLNIVSWIYIILGIIYALLGLAAIGGLLGISELAENDLLEGTLNISAVVVGIILLVIAGLNILGGLGIRNFRNWARILIIVLSVINLFNFPIGTAIGAYSLYALFKPDVRSLFNRQEKTI